MVNGIGDVGDRSNARDENANRPARTQFSVFSPGRPLGPALLGTRYFALAVLFTALTLLGCASSNPPSARATSSLAPTPTAGPGGQVPSVGHIFVIVMENREYDQVIGSADAPYLNQLANTYGLATRYYAIRHPSLPNYLALTSGSTHGVTDDCATCTVNSINLVDQLEAHRKTWAAYMEDLPNPCFNGASAGGPLALIGRGGYVRRHDPFMYYDNVRESSERCHRVVSLSQLTDDLANNRVPNFAWITPNLQHDMHSSDTRAGDDWLASFVPTILGSSAWKDGGVLFITWDEGTTDAGCCDVAAGGHVPTLVIAANGKRGYRSGVPYNHYSLLRTIEDLWGLDHLGHAADPATKPMSDFFR